MIKSLQDRAAIRTMLMIYAYRELGTEIFLLGVY
jgi:hypothetical protein